VDACLVAPCETTGTGGRLAIYPAKKIPAARKMPSSTFAGLHMTLLFSFLE
jgi:hypothetical protein